MPYEYDGTYDPESKTFAIPPVGKVRVRIEEATEEVSANGNDMMVLVCKVLDGAGKGSHLWEYIVYNQFAQRTFGSIMNACGLAVNVKRNIKPELFVNREAVVQIKHETYNENKRAKIAYWVFSETPPEPENTQEVPTPPADDDVPF